MVATNILSSNPEFFRKEQPETLALPKPGAMRNPERVSYKAKSNGKHKRFVDKIATNYPQFIFEVGEEEHWSPKTKTISYNPGEPDPKFQYGLLHELAHAVLGHKNYHSDFELLKLESEAWELATSIGKKYGVKITDEHVQNCLDTYRNWLHGRSACPKCGMHVIQDTPNSYHCFNCQSNWQVTGDRFVRSYRRASKTKTAR